MFLAVNGNVHVENPKGCYYRQNEWLRNLIFCHGIIKNIAMSMKNYQLLKDSNVQLKTIRQARMMADRLVD